jgi:hypothetical protein
LDEIEEFHGSDAPSATKLRSRDDTGMLEAGGGQGKRLAQTESMQSDSAL